MKVSIGESLEEEPTYQGPMTQSHTQALMKANLIMMMHFGEDYIFKPRNKTWSIQKFYQSLIEMFHQVFHC